MTRSKKNRKKKSRAASDIVDSLNVETGIEKLDSLIEEAEVAVDSFEYDEAESKLKEVLQIDPNNCKCLEMLSSIYIEKFKWPEAQDLLKQCIEISPEVGYSKYFSIAQLYEGLESISYYEKGIQILQKELENVEPSKDQSKSTLLRILSDAYCSISELYMTDCCFEEDAEEKCSSVIDLAVKSDPSNPEALQCLASFQIVKGQIEEAKESLKRSLSSWLPHLKLEENDLDENSEKKSLPEHDSRIKASKLLIEVEMYYEACKVLESLLEEDDEDAEVWYHLGWVNYTRNEKGYKGNAKFYLKKAMEIFTKNGNGDDECIDHIHELLEDLDASCSDDDEAEENNQSDFSTDFESDEEMEV